MANENKYQYLFNIVFDSIMKTFNIDEDFLDKELYDNYRRTAGTVHQWRYKGTPPKHDFYVDFLRDEIEFALADIIDKNKDNLPPVISNFKHNAIRNFSPFIRSIEQLLSMEDPVECALSLLDYCFDLNKPKLISKIISAKDESITDQAPARKSKPSSQKLDEEMIEQLKSIGAEVETEEELYAMLMNFSLHLLEDGTDDDFAFSWLDEVYDKPDLQDNICGFALMLYENEDYERAFKIFLGLAKQGHTIAQTFVGDCYHYGKGIEPNLGIAYNWYAKVADIKDDESADIAQMGLVMCLLGMAHIEDSDFLLQLAISTAQKYAESGNAQVQYVLACAYRNGKGVPKNDSLAHFWMGEAARNGLLDAIKIMNNEANDNNNDTDE